MRERLQAREANAALGALTPLESSLVSDIELINTAHADPDFRGLRLNSTRGGDESRRLSPAAAAEARQAAVGGAGEEGTTAQQTALVALSDLGSVAGKSRALSEGLWGRAFLTAYNSASDGERLRMAEGLGKGAGLALLAVPMADAFDFTQSQFQRILSNYLGLDGAISIPHTHHCGGGVTRVLTQGTVNHLQVCPVLGRNSAPHNAVRDVLSHLVVQNGVTNAAVVETRLTARNGGTFDADVVYFDPSSRARVILEVSIVTIGSDTSLGRGARAGLDGVNAQLRAREEEKRNHGVVRRLLNEAGNNTIFTPIGDRYVSLQSYGTLDGSLPQTSLRPSEGHRQVPHVAAAGAKVHLEHNGDFVVLGYAPEHSMRGHGRRVPEPHHPSRQHPQPPRRGASAPPRHQLRATRGGAPPCRCLKDFGMKCNAL